MPNPYHTLPGLDYPFDLKRSVALWQLLLDGLHNDPRYLTGGYRYKPRSAWHPHRGFLDFDAEALRSLRRHAWLFGADGKPRPPSELSLDTLHRDYARRYPPKDNQVAILEEKLGLQPSQRASLPERDQRLLALIGERSPEEVEVILRYYETHTNPEDDEKAWTPTVEPGRSADQLELVPAKPRPSLTTSGATSESTGGSTGEGRQQSPRSKPSKPVGDWGEEHIVGHLEAKYLAPEYEVVWCNEDDTEQEGYDIRVERDGIPVEYAEVKARQEPFPLVVEISGRQWDFARILNRKGEGDTYVLYVVANAGTKNAQFVSIPDPVGAWEDGTVRSESVAVQIDGA